MKGSDKKKFKSDIRKRFPYFTDPDVDQDLLNDLIPNKEELIVTKIETHNGEYVLLYQQKQKNTTLFFELEKEKTIFPTLFTLWQCPSMLPTMTTCAPVVQKLANGADLMLPGIIINDSLGTKAYGDGKIKKDDIMSVNLDNNKACVAVGTSALSSEDMYMSGKRGKALKILHCFGDHLWIHFGKLELPELGVPENILEFLNKKLEEVSDSSNISDDDDDEAADDENVEEASNEPNEENKIEELGQGADQSVDNAVDEIQGKIFIFT